MKLCTLCAGLGPNVNQYRHHSSAAELATSADQCNLCQLIHRLLKDSGQLKKAAEYQTRIDGKLELLEDTSITISTNRHAPPDPDSKSANPYRLVVSCGPLKRRAIFEGGKDENAPFISLGIFANEGTPAADLIDKRPVPIDCNTPQMYELIRHWISECAEQHNECLLGYMDGKTKVSSDTIDELRKQMRDLSSNEEAPLPTRVLDLTADGDADSIRLIETGRIQGVYVALSHCWGLSTHLVTTRNSLKDRLANIAFDHLPPTFKDAVTITRQLGQRYLWIDSLCIIQDDIADWEIESSLMGEVYRNAHFTIAAAASVDGDGGCLGPRSPSSRNAIAMPFPSAANSPTTTTTQHPSQWYIYEDHSSYSKSVWQAPLQQRVWTLQERCLSRRIIHFAHDQMYFECNRSVRSEDGKPEAKHTSDYVNFSMLYSMKNLGRNSPFQALMQFILSRQWVMLVESITDRKLTREEDMLPALSGITSQLYNITGIESAAGLLRGTVFPDMLLWRVQSYHDVITTSSSSSSTTKTTIHRPQSYRGPSWSWISVTEPVLFATGGYEPVEPLHLEVLIEEVEIQVQPQGKDPHGRVASGGTLRLTGWLVEVETLGTNPDTDFDEDQADHLQWASFMYRARTFTGPNTMMSGYHFVRSTDRHHALWGTAAYDDKGSALGDRVYALLVKEKEKEKDKKENPTSEKYPQLIQHVNSFLVLFLSPVDDQGDDTKTYRRVGMGQLVQSRDIDFGEKSSITIV